MKNYTAKSYLEHSRCETASRISRITYRNNRYSVMKECIEKLCTLMKGESLDETFFEELRDFLYESYDNSWFQLDWQKDVCVEDDIEILRRFYRWFLDAFPKAELLECNRTNSYLVDESTMITSMSNLILSCNGVFYSLQVDYAKNKKSLSGRSVETNAKKDLSALITKMELEKDYPGITIVLVSLLCDDDKLGNVMGALKEGKTKDSNVFYLPFDEYYDAEKKCFLRESFNDCIKAVLETTLKRECTSCFHRKLCELTTIFDEIVEEEEEIGESCEKPSVSYTDRQWEAIRKTGPCLICAGPGSGKTATIVGKVKYMIEERGIEPSIILMISFTNEAVKVMRNRCREFCDDDLPNISTVHALSYAILKKHAELLGRNTELPLLTENVIKETIRNLLESTYSLDGLSLGTSLSGDYGLLNTLYRYYNEYLAVDDDAFFLERHKNLGEEFLQFVKILQDIIQKREYITFDEQIEMCLTLLKENPNILQIYQNLYRYILVDEFQDIDEKQAELIYLLCDKHHEITVVGDDDQNIYGWRGGTNKFMLEFGSRFGTNPIVLDKNFRSSEHIVKASNSIIEKQTQARIKKDVTAAGKDNDFPVTFIRGKNVETIDAVIKECVESGYHYRDIAVLARTNDELMRLDKALKAPSVLGKSYFCDSALFRLMLICLQIADDKLDNALMFELMCLWNLKELAFSIGGNLLDELAKMGYTEPFTRPYDASEVTDDLVWQMFYFVRNMKNCATIEGANADIFLENFVFQLGISDSPFYDSVRDMYELYHITTIEDVRNKFMSLAETGDKTKLALNHNQDKVLLFTLHESKGCEFPVCIVLDDDKSDYTDPESLRVLYVGITRPKERVYLISNRQLCMLDGIFTRREV